MMELTRRRIWFAVFVLVVFAIGLTAGVALDRYFMFGRRPAFARGLGPAGSDAPGMPGVRRAPRPADIAGRLARDLGLSTEQKTQLEGIFARGAERMQKFHAGTRRQFDELRQQLDAEISAILTPEQRAKFEERRTQRREWRPPGERGPGEPPGPPR